MEDQNTKPTNLQKPDPVVQAPTQGTEPIKPRIKSKEKWSLKKMLTVIGGSIVLFIIALITIVTISTSAPVKVSDELVANIQANNATAAYSLLSDDAKATISADNFKTTIEQVSPILTGKPDLQSKEINANSNNTTSSKVIYKITGSDGITYKFTVNLVEVNKEWKVLNFESKKDS